MKSITNIAYEREIVAASATSLLNKVSQTKGQHTRLLEKAENMFKKVPTRGFRLCRFPLAVLGSFSAYRHLVVMSEASHADPSPKQSRDL